MKTVVRAVLRRLGYEIRRLPGRSRAQRLDDLRQAEACRANALKLGSLGITKAHYGCGPRLFGEGWANIDLEPRADTAEVYLPADLTLSHPFPSDFFSFAFAEDFLEHLDQPESLIFLSEAYRTLRPGGVLRLSFPGLAGVLRKHYPSSDWHAASVGQHEAYTVWGHKHFYCQESLSLVATHLGFSDIAFVEYGLSQHRELCNLDARLIQQEVNIHAELTK